MTRLLEVEGLEKSFEGLKAVDGISFYVDAGEVFGLLGPNGAGKSTTMMMICGLLSADAGTVTIAGSRLDGDDIRLRTMLGVVPQDLAIYPDLTARENLDFFGRLYGLRGEELRRRIDEVLTLVGLHGRRDDLAETYSGGMKRRLNFAVGILHRPKLLILDEPTVGVDPQSRTHLLDCIRRLNDERVAVIYASHYMEEVQSICHRVGIMDAGRLVACDTVEGLLDRLSSDLTLKVPPLPGEVAAEIGRLADIREPETGEGWATVVVSRDQHAQQGTLNLALMRVLRLLDEAGILLHEVETHEPNLERLFLELTGKSLRD